MIEAKFQSNREVFVTTLRGKFHSMVNYGQPITLIKVIMIIPEIRH